MDNEELISQLRDYCAKMEVEEVEKDQTLIVVECPNSRYVMYHLIPTIQGHINKILRCHLWNKIHTKLTITIIYE
jgi:predicted transcriptional regulator YdeE